MTYNFDLIENTRVLDYVDYLEKNQLNPTIAIYQGKTLMITSYQATSFSGKIYQIFLKIKTALFSFFNLIDTNAVKIKEIKTRVTYFHYSKCDELPEMVAYRKYDGMIKLMKEEGGKSYDLLGNVSTLLPMILTSNSSVI